MMNIPFGETAFSSSRNGLLNTGTEGSVEPMLPPDKSSPEFATFLEEKREVNLSAKEAPEVEGTTNSVDVAGMKEGSSEESPFAFNTAPVTEASADQSDATPEPDAAWTENAVDLEDAPDQYFGSRQSAHSHTESDSRAPFMDSSSRPERSGVPVETPPPADLEVLRPGDAASRTAGEGKAQHYAALQQPERDQAAETRQATTRVDLALTTSSAREAMPHHNGPGPFSRPTWTPSTEASSNNIHRQNQMISNASDPKGAHGRRDATLSLQPIQNTNAEQVSNLPLEQREPPASLTVPWRAGSLESQGTRGTGQDWRPTPGAMSQAPSYPEARPAETTAQTSGGTPQKERPVTQNQPSELFSLGNNTPAQSPDRGRPLPLATAVTSEPSDGARHDHILSNLPGRRAPEGRDQTPAPPQSTPSTATTTAVPTPKILPTVQPEQGREEALRAFEPEIGRSSTVASPIGHPESTTSLRPATMNAVELPRHVSQQLTHAFQTGARNQADIILSPVELGRVRINLHTNETGVMVSIVTERPETLDLLRRHADMLAEEFRDIGYDATEFSFSNNSGSKSQFNDDAPNSGSGEHGSDAIDTVAPDLPANTQPSVISLDRVDIRF